MSDLENKIRDYLDRVEHVCGCRAADALRDVLDVIEDDDPPVLVKCQTTAILLTVGLRLGLVDREKAQRDIRDVMAVSNLLSGEIEAWEQITGRHKQ